eukprot:s490_g9.t1
MKANASDRGLMEASNITGTERIDDCSSSSGIGVKACEFKGCILHLFSGPENRADGFAAALRSSGWECEEYDIANGPDGDLASDHVWSTIMNKMKEGYYKALLAGPPCNTFTNARKHDGQGPAPLRSPTGPERYGYEWNNAMDKEKVKYGNLLAIRTAEAFGCMHEQRKPAIVEQPRLKEDDESTSMYKLDEFLHLRSLPGVEMMDLLQCRYGAMTSKPTTLMTCELKGAAFHNQCNHPLRMWVRPTTGAKHWGSHPPLRGKEWYIPESEWDKGMLATPAQIREREKSLPFLTSAAQAYPADLNKELAQVLTTSIVEGAEGSLVKTSPWTLVRKRKNDMQADSQVTTRQRMMFTSSSKKRNLEHSDEEENAALGGMRHPNKALKTIPGYREMGIVAYNILMKYLDENPGVQERCIGSIGSHEEDAGPSDLDLAPVREQLNVAFTSHDRETVKLPLDTQLQAGMLWRMARAAGDPDADEIYGWLTEGAPAGIEQAVKDDGNIFPGDAPLFEAWNAHEGKGGQGQKTFDFGLQGIQRQQEGQEGWPPGLAKN